MRKVWVRGLGVLVTLASAVLPVPVRADVGPIPQWIWSTELPLAGESVSLSTRFAVRAGLAGAELSGLADDVLKVTIDDEPALEARDWKRWTTVELPLLKAGDHRITCHAENKNGYAGCAIRLRLRYEDGTVDVVTTDPTWTSPTGPAVSHGLVGSSPWGDPAGESGDYYQWKDALGKKPAEPAASIRVLPGFEAELIRSAGPGESSWISLTFDPQGRILLGCEGRDKKHGLLRLTLPAGPSESATVESVEETLLEPRGLAFGPDGKLYANANNALTLMRVEDSAGGGKFDRVTPLRKSPGGVGHGRNNLTFGPDGALYSIHGNDVRLPEDFRPDENRLVHQSDDRLLPCRWDRFLFDYAAKLPAGHLIRSTDPAASWELLAGGFRNPYGIDFNTDSELFTFDADNEGDLGTPWYRPTRINHVVSGGDYGWRQGTAMRPTWYPDILPATLEIGKTSPTDVKFGTRSNFPRRLRESLFILDWSYGKIHAIRPQLRGASYAATAETFLEGKPLNVTDLEFGPDGALYFTTGGRATQSGLYRVRYTGLKDQDETGDISPVGVATRTSPLDSIEQNQWRLQHEIRRLLQTHHNRVAPQAILDAWGPLGDPDRWLRSAARVAIESQPVETWRDRALAETRPLAAATALLALSRSETPDRLKDVVDRILTLPLGQWRLDDHLVALRALQVALHRSGAVPDDRKALVAAYVANDFPTQSWSVNQLAAELLVFTGSSELVPRAIPLLRDSQLQEEQMLWLFLLRNVRVGWTLETRREYLRALAGSDAYQGGRELPVALFGITSEFRETLTADERAALAPELAAVTPDTSPAALQPSRPFVKEWKLVDLADQIEAERKASSIEAGRTLYRDALCVRCHRYGGEGKPIGPDLHAISRRMSRRDLLETILVPSKVIDEKFRDTTFVLTTGKVLAGRIVGGDDTMLLVAPNATSPFDTVTVRIDEIESRQPSPVSPMPVGLLNTFTEEQILDLLAYLGSDQAEFKR